ncbi:MAG: hypothetical protein CMP91_06220 [Gammaproteobacteria bacterium]|nr:hypothetical protein [Gammaproteobacteria bacterium]|tara:strand:+ start:42946 stop:44148 length:1203 start_codon:yes stop_codon:yes gene_type:complete
MNTVNIILFILLVLAMAVSWYMGYRSQRFFRPSLRYNKDERDYFIGLNYLLNDEPDQSVDAFISELEVNSSTLESHLALGTLLRRRGKVDSSIAVFQKLLGDSQFDKDELNKVKLGLVKSYVAAGLLDRAERLIDELKIADLEIQYAALIQGLTVYQLEKEWLKCVMISNELLQICPANQRQSFQLKASHFYCELAEKEIELQHYNQAREYLNRAVQMSRTNVRANLLLGRLELALQLYRQAIKVLQKISTQDPGFRAEAFDLLVSAFEASGRDKDLQAYLESCLHESPGSGLILKIVSYIESKQNRENARKVLLQQLSINPSINLLGKAILLNARADEQSNAELFNKTLEQFLNSKPAYQCTNCGFELQKLHWQCPGCSEWGHVKPLELQADKATVRQN